MSRPVQRRPSRIRIFLGIALGLGAAALQPVAASAEVASTWAQASRDDYAAKQPEDTRADSLPPKSAAAAVAGVPAAGKSAGAPEAKPSRLRFRTADGTCACTCASGGMSELAIQKAQEARERTGP